MLQVSLFMLVKSFFFKVTFVSCPQLKLQTSFPYRKPSQLASAIHVSPPILHRLDEVFLREARHTVSRQEFSFERHKSLTCSRKWSESTFWMIDWLNLQLFWTSWQGLHLFFTPPPGFPSGATAGYAKSQVRDILKAEFNKSVELQVRKVQGQSSAAAVTVCDVRL